MFFAASAIKAEPIALVPVGGLWKYYLGTNAPPTNWFHPGFDDSTWTERPSGFSSGRTFDLLEATLWPPATNYVSAFLRTRFDLEEAADVRSLTLRIDYNDGFVAYLNGQEIARRGLTNEPVLWNDLPVFHPGGAAEEIDVTAAIGWLQEGENILAVQVHNATNATPAVPASSSIWLLPELLANFTRGPYLQNVSAHRVEILWNTPFPADSVVEYGLDQTLGSQVGNGTLKTNHALAVTNLLSDRRYWYRVRNSSSNDTVVSPLASFQTFRTNGPVVFHVIGDTGGQVVQQGSGIVPQYRLASLMAQHPADLVLHCGDAVYPEFSPGREDTRHLSIYRHLMSSVPMFSTIGNHEFDPDSGLQTYLATFSLPTNSATGTEHFYSFDHGDVHFVSLFVPQLNWGGEPPNCGCLPQYALTNGSLQYAWLTNDLASTAKPWKVLFFHLPINSSGNHRFDDFNNDGIEDRLELQELLYPLAKRYGVQLMLNGHDHVYEKFTPTNGVYSIVTGGGGGPLPQLFFPRTPQATKRDAGSSQFYLNWHFLTISVADETMRVEAIGTNGLVFDTTTITRSLPSAPTLHEASWHTPVIESIPANDGQGNVAEQTFDFIGTPLPTVSGDFSNLGRVFVNNDSTHLYIGFEQAMLSEDNNIFLFVESPHLAGVSNLVGLGDGMIGTGEGVEGLDRLENLAFTNFHPAVAVLLGDEYADATDRFFSRPDLGLANVGQGVFRLDAGLSTVESARLQQFNRSPQRLEPSFQRIYPEQNANFIEVALPLSELGLNPGETIKLAAVVGGSLHDSQTQFRQLDSSFLGISFAGGGLSNSVIAGRVVRLALDPSADEDMDGLPNGWEQDHGLDPRLADGDDGASGDPDGDRMTNREEFIAGTDPRDSSSALRMRVENIDPDHVLLSWSSVIGRRYQLQTGNSPFSLTNHPSEFFPRTAVSNREFFLDSLTNPFAPGVARFYRLEVSP